MRKILFIASQAELTRDLEFYCIMESMETDIEIKCLNDIEHLDDIVSSFKPDMVVVSVEILPMKENWELEVGEVVYRAKNKNELIKGASYNLKTIGIAKNGSDILYKLKREPFYYSPTENEEDGTKIEKLKDFASEIKSEESKKPHPYHEEIDLLENLIPEANKEEINKAAVEPELYTEDTAQKQETLNENIAFDASKNAPFERVLEELEDDFLYKEEKMEQTKNIYPPETDKPEYKEDPYIKKSQKDTTEKKRNYIEESFLRDISKKQTQTKVVTVYSAKGGVGKTTIASELATYLSLVNLGQRKLRVCLVDYNIDFGNVWATLSIPQEGANLAYWAVEVQEMIRNGKSLKDICYSKRDIEDFMHIDKKSGLYILPAPFTHEDSMGIESKALSIILRNIINYGDFDYVICDTGNNTRDSTMIALEAANLIFLIMTQNINTAICDKAFMDTMKSIDFDLSNTKLIINYIMPQKSTNMSVQEIVDYFPFDCIGKLKFNPDVIRATNVGEPLAFQPDHDFTKQMRNIVSYILHNNEYQIETKKKKGLFSFLFRR